jgi:putative transposase
MENGVRVNFGLWETSVARQPRLVVPGYPHHVIQRGNNRQAIVIDDHDRTTFLRELGDLAAERALAVHAYVLMDNHIHLLATPQAQGDLSWVMQALGRRYVHAFNRRHGRTGTLWEGRFRAAVVETDRYFLACQRYIELNPVRAGVVEDAADFRWSSAQHHLGIRSDALVSDHSVFWTLGNTPFEREAAYRELLAQGMGVDEAGAITQATLRARVLGSSGFVEQLSRITDRPISQRPRGRPRRAGAPLASQHTRR